MIQISQMLHFLENSRRPFSILCSRTLCIYEIRWKAEKGRDVYKKLISLWLLRCFGLFFTSMILSLIVVVDSISLLHSSSSSLFYSTPLSDQLPLSHDPIFNFVFLNSGGGAWSRCCSGHLQLSWWLGQGGDFGGEFLENDHFAFFDRKTEAAAVAFWSESPRRWWDRRQTLSAPDTRDPGSPNSITQVRSYENPGEIIWKSNPGEIMWKSRWDHVKIQVRSYENQMWYGRAMNNSTI